MNQEECSLTPFCLWESVFASTPDSLPLYIYIYIYLIYRAQFLIIFFVLRLNSEASHIPLKLDISEVDAAVWISLDKVTEIFDDQTQGMYIRIYI